MPGLSRFCLTTKRCTPAASHAFTSASASSSRVAIGFSQITCSPRSAAMIPCRGCSPLGVQITTASASDSASIAA